MSIFISRVLGLLAVMTGVFGAADHISGALQTESGNQDRRPGSWDEVVKYLDPDRMPFLGITSRIKAKRTTDPEFKLFEREHRSRWVRLNEALDASETGVDVDDGAAFSVDDICLIPDSGEMFRVSSISGNTLTVVRGTNGSTAATASDNAWVKILFERQEENGRSGTPLTTDYTTVSNFVQIFKQKYGLSRTNKSTRKRGPADLSEERKLSLQRIKEDIEQAVKWGKKRMEVSGGDVYRYTGGFDEFVSTNRLDAEGGLGFGDIGWIMNQVTRHGGTKKIWLVGRDARQQLDSLGLDYMRIGAKENMLGMAVDGFRTSFGEAMMVTDHSLENAHADRILVVDPGHIAMAVLMGLKHEANIQENDRDGELHQFIAEVGLWLDTEQSHAVITGVSDTI
jgi:hypothetical protein